MINNQLYVILPYEELEDTSIHTSKDRQHNGRKNKNKRTNNDLLSTTQKTNDQTTRTPLKRGVNSGAPEEWAVPVPLLAPVVLL